MCRCMRAVLATVFAASIFVPTLQSQEAPAAGTYAVPADWKVESSAERVILSVPGDRALIYLMIYRDARPGWRVAQDFVDNQRSGSAKLKVLSRDMYHHGGKEVTHIDVTLQTKAGGKRHEWVMGIPVDNGNLLLVVNTEEGNSTATEFGDAIDKVITSVLPRENNDKAPQPMTNPSIGLKVVVGPSWVLDETEGKQTGKYSDVPYMKLTKGNALLSLSSKEDKRSPREYVAEVEKNTRAQSRSYDKLSEQIETIAGVQGTRLDVRTVNQQGIPVRRWIYVFARNGRHYVVAAGAPDSSFDQYATDFKEMIASITFAE